MVGRLAKSLEFLLDIGGKVRCSLFSTLLGFTLRLSCKIQKQVSFQKYLLGYYSKVYSLWLASCHLFALVSVTNISLHVHGNRPQQF